MYLKDRKIADILICPELGKVDSDNSMDKACNLVDKVIYDLLYGVQVSGDKIDQYIIPTIATKLSKEIFKCLPLNNTPDYLSFLSCIRGLLKDIKSAQLLPFLSTEHVFVQSLIGIAEYNTHKSLTVVTDDIDQSIITKSNILYSLGVLAKLDYKLTRDLSYINQMILYTENNKIGIKVISVKVNPSIITKSMDFVNYIDKYIKIIDNTIAFNPVNCNTCSKQGNKPCAIYKK